MNSFIKTSLVFVPVLCALLISQNGYSQNAFEKDSVYNKWNFRVGPYIWLIGFKGEIINPPAPPIPVNPIEPVPRYEIDVSFKDIRHSIKFIGMLNGQYRNNHAVFQFNVSSLVLESQAITPFKYVLSNNIVKLTYVSGDFGMGYRMIKKQRVNVDVLIGGKFLYFGIGVRSTLFGKKDVSVSRSQFVFDGLLGVNFKYRPHPRWELLTYGDLGPRLLDRKDFSYQYIAGLNFLFTKTFLGTLGYRSVYYTNEMEDAVFNGKIQGPIVRFTFQF